MLARDEPLRETEAVIRRSRRKRRQRGGHGAGDFAAGLVVLAALEEKSIARLRALAHHHHVGDSRAEFRRGFFRGGERGVGAFRGGVGIFAVKFCQFLALRWRAFRRFDEQCGADGVRHFLRVFSRRFDRWLRGCLGAETLLPSRLQGRQRLVRLRDFRRCGLHRGLELREFFLLLGRGQRQHGFRVAAFARAARAAEFIHHAEFVVGIEVGEELVKFLLRDRVVFVIVTAAAVQRERHPREPGRLHAVDHRFRKPLLDDAPALAVEPVIALKAGRHDLVTRRVWQQVAGELLDRKTVERHVRIQRANHPVAPRPLLALRVALESVAVRIACHVEPARRHVLAVARRSEQPVHHALIRAGRGVFLKIGDLLRRRRQAREIERRAADQRFPRRLGRWLQSLFRELF